MAVGVAEAGAKGDLHSVRAERDEGRRFVSGPRRGGRVRLVYTELVALSVEE